MDSCVPFDRRTERPCRETTHFVPINENSNNDNSISSRCLFLEMNGKPWSVSRYLRNVHRDTTIDYSLEINVTIVSEQKSSLRNSDDVAGVQKRSTVSVVAI